MFKDGKVKFTPPILLLLLSLTAFSLAQSSTTAQIAPHAGKTLTYQYTSDANGKTLWIDRNVAPGFIQYNGLTCPITAWVVNQVYPLPSATNRTQPAFSLQAIASCSGVTFSVVETGYSYWAGYGRTAGVYYFVQGGTITETIY